MPQIVDESDLIADESDLETPAETAAKRKAAIEASSIPETSRPPLWNPKSRAAVRNVVGVAAPTIAAAPFAGGRAILAGMGGAAAAEGIDYAMSPEGEKPSVPGMVARTAAQGVIPAVLGKVGQKLAPLAEKIPAVLPRSVMESEAMGAVRGVIHKARLFKALTTTERETLDGIVKETSEHSPLIDAKDLLAALDATRKKVSLGKASYDEIVDAVKLAAKESNGNVPLAELHAILRAARAQVGSKADAVAVDTIKTDILNTMEKHITTEHPLGAKLGPLFRKLNNTIGTKLGIAEDAARLVEGNPLPAVLRIASDPDKLGIIQALDHQTGSAFRSQIEALAAKYGRETAKAGTAAALKVAQADARQLLKGIITASAIGTGGMSNVLMSLLVGRLPGQLPLEGAIAKTAIGAAKAAPAMTAAAGQGLSDLFPEGIGDLFGGGAAPAPVAESDLEKETP